MNTSGIRAACNQLCDQIEAAERLMVAGKTLRQCFQISTDETYAGNIPPGIVVVAALRSYDEALAAFGKVAESL